MKIKRVTKKRAEELAMQLLGTRKGNKKVFQTFFLAGKWYEGEVLEVFIWVGNYYNREMLFALDTMEEIYYEYKRNEK